MNGTNQLTEVEESKQQTHSNPNKFLFQNGTTAQAAQLKVNKNQQSRIVH